MIQPFPSIALEKIKQKKHHIFPPELNIAHIMVTHLRKKKKYFFF